MSYVEKGNCENCQKKETWIIVAQRKCESCYFKDTARAVKEGKRTIEEIVA